jgi:hypothetical protein
VRVNGTAVVDEEFSEALPAAGAIGLESYTGRFDFRNLFIQELPIAEATE